MKSVRLVLYGFLLIALLLALMPMPLTVTAEATAAPGWWDTAWPYRLRVTVPAGAGVAEVALDFTGAFAALGLNGALLDVRSIRVVDAGGNPVPYAETYTTLLEDAEAPQIGWHGSEVYWTVNDGVVEADTTRFSEGAGSLKAVVENLPGGYGYPGVELRIASGDSLTDWSPYESFIYDVWPEVNASALDQAPDLYWYKLYNACGGDPVTQGGPPLALDQWNPVSVSLNPLDTCTPPDLDLGAITRMEFHTRDNATVHGNSGLWDDGDTLTLWFDNLRLVDQDNGVLRWQTDGSTTAYDVYFDTLAHEGHPLPALADPGAATMTGAASAPEAGGYLHLVAGASTGGLAVWSAPPVEKVLKTHAVPAVAAPLRIAAAQGEFEPFQLVVRSPSAQSLPVTISDFVRQGGGGTIPAAAVTLHRVDYVPITRLSDPFGRLGDWPDPLYPIEMGANVSFPADENQPLWFTVEVPRDAAPGIYEATVQVGAATIPVQLEVWAFALPQEIHLAGEWGFGWSSIVELYKGTDGGVQPCYWNLVDALYEDFADHRLTPKGVGWPAGLNFDYNCETGVLDPDHNGNIWYFESTAQNYLRGDALDNGAGFPSFLIRGPASNWPPASRPSSFCSESRGTDPPGNAAYNTAWFQYWDAVGDYLASHPDYAAKGYYHIVNEPQTFDDYDIVAYLAQATKAAAPEVRILISEQVEPAIYANATYPSAKIDVWMPTISSYQVARAHDRQQHHGESVWWYFLYGDNPPLPNPTVMDRPGIEARVTPWLAWMERVEGLVYYATTLWSAGDPWTEPWLENGNGDGFLFYPPKDATVAFDPCVSQSNRLVTSIRWELLREGMEDYEYLWLLNGGDPVIGEANDADSVASTFIASRTRFSRVPTDLDAARAAIAAQLTGPTASKRASRSAVILGASFDYELIYHAGSTAHTVTISDTVPAATTVVTASASTGAAPTVQGQSVRWTGALAAQDVVTVTITALGAQPGSVTNTATFSGTQRWTADAAVLVAASRVFLPVVLRNPK